MGGGRVVDSLLGQTSIFLIFHMQSELIKYLSNPQCRNMSSPMISNSQLSGGYW